MAIPLRCLALLSVIVLLVAILPAGAAHGGGPASSSSHGGGSGAAMSFSLGSGGPAPPGPSTSGQGDGGVQAQAGLEMGGRLQPQGAGSFGSVPRPGADREEQAQSHGYTRTGDAAWAGAAVNAAGAGRIGSGPAFGGGDASPGLPAGRQRGPPARTPPAGPGTQAGRYPCGPAQTAEPLGGALGPADPPPSPATSPRARKDGEWDESSPAAPEHATPPFLFLPLLGFRRVIAKNVLSHDLRRRVYDTIAAYPGIDALSLAKALGTNPSTLRYHLFMLIRAKKITTFSRPGVVRYYPNQGMYPPFLQCLLHSLWTDTRKEIIMILWNTPGMNRAQLAEALSCSGPSVTRHMQALADDGIVENRCVGRSNHYHLTPAAGEALEFLVGVAPCLALPAEAAPVFPSAA